MLNNEVNQKIVYSGQEYNPLTKTFPQVLARVIKYPNGDYMLLAANLRSSAADVSFEFSGANSVTREFGNKQTLDVADNIFKDKPGALWNQSL